MVAQAVFGRGEEKTFLGEEKIAAPQSVVGGWRGCSEAWDLHDSG